MIPAQPPTHTRTTTGAPTQHRRTHRPLPALLTAAMCAVLAACGGGGGTADTPTVTPLAPTPLAPTAVVLSGTAATGAPMVGAVVRVVDSSGTTVTRDVPVDNDGRFTTTLPLDARAPFALEAVLPDGERQVSVIDSASGATTVNITPITSLIAARLSPNGRPEGLIQRFEQATVPAASDIQASKQEVLQVIAPVREALGDTTDPVSGRFSVGGSGHDKLLDSITVTIVPTSATSTNIELTVRTVRTDDTPLPAVAFASNTPPAQLPQVGGGLRRQDLGAEGTSARIDTFVTELNGCYSLPVDARVTSTTAVPRSAALVKDGPCKTMYWNADPSLFLDNGTVVGNGAANGMFSSDTLVFDRPVYEYTRAGGPNQGPEMVVATMRWTNQRTQARDSMVVHLRAEDSGALKLYGNQYAHPMSLRPIVQRLTHVRADSGHLDHLRTGYNLLVSNRQQDGQPVYEKVEVMAPVGLERSATRDVFVLRPMTGFSNLRMTGSFLPTRSSNVVLLGGDWIDATAATTTPTTSGRSISHPIQLDAGGQVWIDDPGARGWGDERIERLSHKSVWTFRYFLRGNTTDTPDAVQSMTTVSRAPSVREMRQQAFATFSPATLERLRWGAMEPSAELFWMNARQDKTGPFPTEPPVMDFFRWEVPAGAVAPTGLNGFGRTTDNYSIGWEQRLGFDRLIGVTSTQREGSMPCTTPDAGLRSLLCHDGGNSDRFAMKTMFSDFELWGKDLRQVEYSHLHGTYKPLLRRTVGNTGSVPLNRAP